MLDNESSDGRLQQRLFEVTVLGTLSSSLGVALLVGFGVWLGFLNVQIPFESIMFIASLTAVLLALFRRFRDKRSVRLAIAVASGVIAFYLTYSGGVYGAIVTASAAILLVSASVPDAYRVLAGYCMAALMSFALLLSESFSPSAEALRVFMTLALIPYPIARLSKTSLPLNFARVKSLNLLLTLGVLTSVCLMAIEGVKVNHVIAVLVAVLVTGITFKLRRISLSIGVFFLIITGLVALNNGYFMGAVFSPLLLAYLVIPFLLFGPVLNLGGALLILLVTLLGFSQHPGEQNPDLLFSVYFSSLILIVSLFYMTTIRAGAEEEIASLVDFSKHSRWITNTTLGVGLATITLLVFLVLDSYHRFRVETEANTKSLKQLVALEKLLIDRAAGHSGYLLTDDDDFLKLYRDVEAPLQRLLDEISRTSKSDFSRRFAVLLESQDTYYEHTLDLASSGNTTAVIALVSSGLGIAYNNSLGELIEREIADIGFLVNRSEQKLTYTDLTLILAIFITLFLALILGRSSGQIYQQFIFEPLERLAHAFSQAGANRPFQIEPSQLAPKELDHLVRRVEEMAQRNSDNTDALKVQNLILAFATRSVGLYAQIVNLNTLESELSSGLLALFEYADAIAFEEDLKSGDIFHPDDRQTVHKYRLRYQEQSVAYMDADAGLVVRVITKSGKVIWVRHKVRVIHIDDQDYRVGTWQELSTLVAMQETLAHRAGLLQSASEAAGLGIIEFNYSTDQVSVNPSLCQIYGLPNSAFVDFNELAQRWHPEDSERVFAYTEASAQSPQTRCIEFRLIVDGETRWCRMATRTVENEAAELVACAAVLDITDDKHREQFLASEVNELQEQREKQAQMLSVLSHELRTPLVANKLMLEDLPPESWGSYGALIGANTESVLRLLEEFRFVFRPNRWNVAHQITANPLEIIEDAIDSLAGLIQENGLQLHRTYDQTVSREMLFDTQALRQLLINLVKNAAIHSEGSNIWVSVSASAQSEEQVEIVVAVEDDGKGIPSTKQHELFTAFRQGDTQASGLGLGLFIIQELTDILSGNIRCFESAEGGAGFEFRASFVSYTKAEEATDSNYDQETLDAALHGKHVLLAEDQLTLQMLTESILVNAGATVDVANQGVEAMAMFAEQQPDIVITDVMMPQMDGYELCSALRTVGFVGPIIALIQLNRDGEQERLIAAGADSVLPKPLRLDDLKRLLVKGFAKDD